MHDTDVRFLFLANDVLQFRVRFFRIVKMSRLRTVPEPGEIAVGPGKSVGLRAGQVKLFFGSAGISEGGLAGMINLKAVELIGQRKFQREIPIAESIFIEEEKLRRVNGDGSIFFCDGLFLREEGTAAEECAKE